jgi:tRNA dimethylallyltransferase
LAGRKRPLIVIAGATASGKTALALSLAQKVDGEIISADSRQIYRQMDIGTAKPTLEQRALVPHHLIDVVDPDETLSAAQYQQHARAAVAAVHGRGRVALLVGGTGQYITALLEGWTMPEVPPDPALRAELEAEVAAGRLDGLVARLLERDPDAASGVDVRNPRRVIRALEVCIAAGQPFTALRRKHPPDYAVFPVMLTLERERLYERADRRLDQMMVDGFLAEVQHLLDAGCRRDLPSMSGLGYAELITHLLDGVPLNTAVSQAKHATHDFIRRQYTWFRKYARDFLWHNLDEQDTTLLIEQACAWLSARQDEG